jgi:hypothetical protein
LIRRELKAKKGGWEKAGDLGDLTQIRLEKAALQGRQIKGAVGELATLATLLSCDHPSGLPVWRL